MEMLVILGLSLVTYAIIAHQHTAMRRIMKARVQADERRER